MPVYSTTRYFYYHKHYHLLIYKTIITYFCPWLGWEGKTCDENINECDGNPCLNGGMCMDTPGSFVCGCPFGKQTYLIYISIVNNNNIIILELQAVNHDLLVSTRTLLNCCMCMDMPETFICGCLFGKQTYRIYISTYYKQ